MKFYLIKVIAFFLVSIFYTAGFTETFGDINNDGDVDVVDTIYSLNILVGNTPPTHTDADVDEDNRIGLAEAIFGLQPLTSCNDVLCCENKSGYWYSNRCNENQSADEIFIAKLSGLWEFYYTLYGNTYYEYYYFDPGTIQETSSHNGYYEIFGTDSYGNSVRAYRMFYDNYIFINYGFEIIDERFAFHYINQDEVTGLFRIKLKTSSDWDEGDYTNLYGTQLSNE